MWKYFFPFIIFLYIIQEKSGFSQAEGNNQSLLNNNLGPSSILSGNNLTEKNALAIEYYLDELDQQTPIELSFNTSVDTKIQNYLLNRRSDLESILSKTDYYFPIIEASLDKYGLPLELKFIAVIESGLNPVAKSKSGAVGLWQFLYSTCSLFDLQVSSYIDERRDIYKSTDAACRYLKYLYQTFNDWNLVLASYNGGPGEVRKAIERSGGKTDYWEIRPYLSDQAANYVPSFIAMNYVLTYYQRHSIIKKPESFPGFETDTLHINYSVDFNQISTILNIPTTVLVKLNPVYIKNYIPKCSTSCSLVLPKDKITEYLSEETRILSHLPTKITYADLRANAGNTNNMVKIAHKVEPGEYIHKIALNYNCTVENIKAWNQLSDSSLYPGQSLIIWITENTQN